MQKYNGQLIRQFASSVTGNAASGVSITVRRQSDSGLATLYVDNNIAGATLSNPITTTSTGHFAFYAPDDVYTLTFSDSTPVQVIQLQDVAELQAQFEAAVLNAGYIPSGTFAAGATLTQANQVLSDGSSYWRWDGSFPKVVTAGSAPTPVGVGGWFVVSDFALRGELAATDSTVLVGGVEAGDLAARFWDSAVTFTVGSGGDYATISAALIDVQKRKKRYASNVQWYVTLNLLSGFVISEQIMIYGGVDLSWIKITSEGRTVSVNMASLTQYLSSEEVPLFSASSHSKLPFLSNIVFLPNGTGSGDVQNALRSCVCVRQNSSAMLDALTIQNFPGKGILLEYNSVIEARTMISKNNGENLRCRHGSQFHGRSNDDPETTWDFTGGTVAAITVAIASRAYLRYVDVSGSGIGLYMPDLSPEVHVARLTANSCTTGISMDGGLLTAEYSLTFESSNIRRGACIKTADMTVSGPSFLVTEGSEVVVNGSYSGARVSISASRMYANNFSVIGATGSGLEAALGGEFCSIGTFVSKSNTVNGVYATTGGKITVNANADLTLNAGSGARSNGGEVNLGSGTNCRKNGTSDQSADIRVAIGGIVKASGALGGTFTTANTLTVDGVIFK